MRRGRRLTPLGRTTLQRLLSLALEASHAPSRPEFVDIALDGVQRLVACDLVSYNEIGCDGYEGLTRAGTSEFSYAPEVFAGFQRHVHEHPLVTYYRETGDGRAFKISDFLTQREFHALALYREFFAAVGVEHQIAITLPAPRPLVIGVAFSRAKRDFSERDRAVLNALRPYLARAHAAVREREVARAQLDALQRALDEVSDGVVLLTSDGRIAEANPAARALVRDVLGVELEGRLPRELAEPAVERNGRRLYIRAVGGEADIGVRVLSTTPPPEVHGLTPRELEVLASAADGLTAAQTAARLGVSERTIHQHLRNVYRKLEVHGRSAAVARVFGGSRPAVRAPGPDIALSESTASFDDVSGSV